MRPLEKYTRLNVIKCAGNSSKNAVKYRVTLPNSWMQEWAVTKENRSVDLFFNGIEIIVQKASNEEIQGYEKLANRLISISSSGGGASKGTLRFNLGICNKWVHELQLNDAQLLREFNTKQIKFSRV